MYSRKSMNGSVKWLGVPSFLRNDGPPWADNILCLSLRWGVRGTFEIWYLESKPGGHYGSVDVPWRGAVPARLAYLPWSPENARATTRRFHHLACAQSLLYSWNILRDELVAPSMIFGTNRFFNNFCGGFPLVV